ncbi:MAG: GtrA family protein [Minisyncoccia bacterium]
MKLLIVTQAVDSENPVLGFFVRWIKELAKHFERVEVICLWEGKHELPANVRVYSLGKERGAVNRAAYSFRFLSLAWHLQRDYDSVFVHMNQEYILIAGWLWGLLGKRIYMWRNHYAGSRETDIAASFCSKVFCTSRHSYTAKYEKTVFMPVGVDTERFCPDASVNRKPHSILFLARMSPSKRPEMLIDALATLARANTDFSAAFVGSPPPQDERYYQDLKKKAETLGLANRISFLSAVPNSETAGLYRAHDIFVNTSRSGMLDKTIFEAAACGCLSIAASDDWAAQIGEELSFAGGDADALARKLTKLLDLSKTGRETQVNRLRIQVSANSLSHLGDILSGDLEADTSDNNAALLTRYVAAGTIATVATLALTAILSAFTSLNYLLAVTLAYVLGIFLTFALQKYYTFRSFDHSNAGKQLLKFTLVAILNLFVNDILVYLLVGVLHVDIVVLAQTIAVTVIACYSFFLDRYSIFRSGKKS